MIVGTNGIYYIFASGLHCRMCKRIRCADSPQLDKQPTRLTNNIPASLTDKKAMCKSVLHELMHTGKSTSVMANQVNELMILKYERAHLAYLHSIQKTLRALVRKDDLPESVGAYGDADGLCGDSVSAHYIVSLTSTSAKRRPSKNPSRAPLDRS